jgi:PPK2 family polyphosphate:nucleotide phosphotransferase
MKLEDLVVPHTRKFQLDRHDPASTYGFRGKADAQEKLEAAIAMLSELQDVFYANATYALLIVIQGIDASGKDSAIKHVMTGVNPQGVHVYSFKAPSIEERAHDFLWRAQKVLPERGRFAIFNRSYYEEVLITRVDPTQIEAERLPPGTIGDDLWKQRFKQIRRFEKYLSDNGTIVLKFFLHVSREEQAQRLLERIRQPEKNWKFSATDVETAARWPEYYSAYEDMLRNTSTRWAPWHVVPADRKWVSHIVIADALVARLKALELHYPRPPAEIAERLGAAAKYLADELSVPADSPAAAAQIPPGERSSTDR